MVIFPLCLCTKIKPVLNTSPVYLNYNCPNPSSNSQVPTRLKFCCNYLFPRSGPIMDQWVALVEGGLDTYFRNVDKMKSSSPPLVNDSEI